MRTRVLVVVALVACNGAHEPTSLVGEVHIHQFDGGAHLSALFVRTPVPAAAVAGDEILPAQPPSAKLGACTLTSLDPATLPPAPTLVDDGAVHLRASDGTAVDLVPSPGGYMPSPPLPVGVTAFAAGVRVDVAGDGGAAPAFAGSVTTPQPLTLVAPRALAVGDAGDLAITWTADGGGARVTTDLIVSRSDGASALVECRSADSDGGVTIARTLLDGLPPRPRDLQLEVSRDQIVRAPSRNSGQGVILHAGFEAALAAHEP